MEIVSNENPVKIPDITSQPFFQPAVLTEYNDIMLFGPGVKVVTKTYAIYDNIV